MFVVVDYVMEMTPEKSCKYDEYGLFEHLLFLLFVCHDDELVNLLSQYLLVLVMKR